MIMVLTSCRYFQQGFAVLVEQLMTEAPSFQRVLYLDDIKKATKEDLTRTKAIVVDYGESDIKVLNTLLDIKNRYAQRYFIFITRDVCYESTIENILNKEITRYLDVTGKTVSHHRRNIYRKFAVTNLTGLYKKFDQRV